MCPFTLLVDGLDCRGSLSLGPSHPHETLEKTSSYGNPGAMQES